LLLKRISSRMIPCRSLPKNWNSVLTALVLFLIASEPEPGSGTCTVLYPVAPDEAAAKRIAASAIAASPRGEQKRSDLSFPYANPESYEIFFEAGDSTAWEILVYDAEITMRDGNRIRAGSPSYAMRIDRCTGAVSDFGLAM
jgi:hypothetical protein